MAKITAEQAREDIAALYRTWTKSVGEVKELSFLDRHLDDGWRYVDYNGVQRGKNEYLKLVDVMLSYRQDMQQLDVRMASEHIAIVTGVYHALAELKGGIKLDNRIIFTAVWESRDGVWKSLAHHTTKLPDGAGAAWETAAT